MVSEAKKRRMERDFQDLKAKSLEAPRGPHDFVLVLDRLEPDFNPGKIFRSADAFGCREIHLVGMPFFDPGPSMGSFKHVRSVFHDDFRSACASLQDDGYRIYAFMPDAGDSLFEEDFPDRTAFVLGNEARGISFDPADHPGVKPMRIPQYGNPQSLNVSVAASIAMYEWVRQRAVDPGPQGKRGRR